MVLADAIRQEGSKSAVWLIDKIESVRALRPKMYRSVYRAACLISPLFYDAPP